MLVKKTHLAAAAAIAVIAGGFYFDERLDDAEYQADREANVASCVREVTRDAYEASGFTILAARVRLRNDPGDRKAAARYEAIAHSISATFPQPTEAVDPLEMLESEFITMSDGTTRYRLTEKATGRIEAGCRQAFLG
jgi:hypothetical protein